MAPSLLQGDEPGMIVPERGALEAVAAEIASMGLRGAGPLPAEMCLRIADALMDMLNEKGKASTNRLPSVSSETPRSV